jgi:hypothetical protein
MRQPTEAADACGGAPVKKSGREILETAPPANVEAERKLIACILIDPERTAEAVNDRFSVHLFTDPACREFASGILTLKVRGQKPDHSAIIPWLKAHTKLENPAADYLDIIRTQPTATLWRQYLETVFDVYRRREARLFFERGLLSTANGCSTEHIFSDGKRFFDDLVQSAAIRPMLFGELQDQNPTLKPPLIHGLLRRGETANIVSVSKVGKSWLMAHLALCVITGRKFLDTFDCEQARVLYIDNELHPPTIAFRFSTVAEAMGIPPEEYRIGLDVLSLRGQRMDLIDVARESEKIEPGAYGLIVADAYYRFQPPGHNENDNSATMGLYNLMDSIAGRLQCCWVNVHHTSKGAQGDRRISDVGAGAGAQSRAADSHLILREHVEDGAVVFDGVVRSFPPVEPVVLRWQFPLWRPDEALDATKLKGKLTATEQRQGERDTDGILKLVEAFKAEGNATKSVLRGRTGLSKGRCDRLLDLLEAKGSVTWIEEIIKGNPCRVYQATDLSLFTGGQSDEF